MKKRPRILAFAGSTRRDSYNKKLARIAALGARAAGADVTYLDLRDYLLPLFDEDLEAADGVPENARRLKQIMVEHDGFLIASPEYNGSITGLLKNVIDWVSRPSEGETPFALPAFRDKVATLMSTSPGDLGGLRGLVHLRAILEGLGVIMLPDQVTLPKAHEAFREDGSLVDRKRQETVEGLGNRVAQVLAKLVNSGR